MSSHYGQVVRHGQSKGKAEEIERRRGFCSTKEAIKNFDHERVSRRSATGAMSDVPLGNLRLHDLVKRSRTSILSLPVELILNLSRCSTINRAARLQA